MSLEGLPLEIATPAPWVRIALSDVSALLKDHAHCELKAATTAMGLAGRFAERSDLVRDMTALAREEMRHFERVHALVRERGETLTPVRPDRYVRRLRRAVLGGLDGIPKIVDQLLLCGFVEARSCERFRLLASAEETPEELRGFYGELARAEGRHHELFFRHAAGAGGEARVASRVREIAALEAEVLRGLPLEPRIH